MKSIIRFLGHDDALRIGPTDIVAFKDHRLTTPSPRSGRLASPKTVRDSDLAALRTLFGWAVMNHLLPSNPAQGLTIKVGRKPQLRLKGFTDTEALSILSASLAYVGGAREHERTAAAKRWVPWLCAFTGARVGEIGQLRKQDVRCEGATYVIRITPEAGTVKTNEAREVPLHPQIVSLGFPAFVESSASGPLFLVPDESGDVLGPLDGLKNRLREFVRSIIDDPNVQPNHGWRHRFTTICIDAGISARVYNAIQGHAGASVADRYGDVTLKARTEAVTKLPAFDIRQP